MKNIKSVLAVMAFSLLILGVPAIASAQYGGYGNGNYGDIRGTIQDLKSRAKNFEKQTDRMNNNGRYGNYGNGNIEQMADRFSDAADKLEDKYGRGRNLNNSADEARRVLDLGQQIESSLYGNGAYGGRNRNNGNNNNYLINEWNVISNELRMIAGQYGMNYNGGYQNNRNYPNGNQYPNGNRYPNGNQYPNGNGGGVWRNGQKPSWWPF